MKLSTTVLGVVVGLAMLIFAASSDAGVYINNINAPIVVAEGQSVDVPIFFEGRTYVNNPVELVIAKVGMQTSAVQYFDVSGWHDTTIAGWDDTVGIETIPPAVTLDAMIDYVYLIWQAVQNTTGMESFQIVVCLDPTIDGHYTMSTADCDWKTVAITPAPQIASIVATPASIAKSVEKGKSTVPVQISVTDDTGKPITFDATSSQPWIGLAKQQGVLTVTLNATTLTAATYSGTITLTSGNAAKTVNVSLTVTNPAVIGFPIFGGGGGCTATTFSAWPVSVSTESGTTKQAVANVTNSCGAAVSFNAAVTSGNTWLSAPTTGSGTLMLTINAVGMAAGSYQGTISLSANGLTAGTLSVMLTVTGECIPNAIYINPSTISKTALTGVNAENVPVTVKTNCGADLDYTITGVSANWSGATAISGITSPAVNSTGKGSFTVSFNTSALAAGSYQGSISLSASLSASAQPQSFTIPVTVKTSQAPDPTAPSAATRIENAKDNFYGFNPGDVKWFVFEEKTADGVNDNVLLIQTADMIQANGFYNVDLLVRYVGPTCDDSKMPTMSDRDRYLRGELTRGQDGFYGSFGADAFESIIIQNNPEGCYYMMVANVDVGAETKIRVKYSDIDSM